MQDINLWFVEQMANPHCWLLTANNLHEQALLLHSNRGRGMLTRIDRHGVRTTWDDTNRSVFLLGGFALENAIKGFLVFENPSWISNGRLSRVLKSHRLTHLQNQSATIPYKARYLTVLRDFESGLESWARYPCALTAQESEDEGFMRPALWSDYLRLMRAYNNRLVRLLSKGWQGPHGFWGRWTFDGDWIRTANRKSLMPSCG